MLKNRIPGPRRRGRIERSLCRTIAVTASGILALGVVACDRASETRTGRAPGEAGADAPIRVEDDAGRSLTLSAPPERIVSLVPSATEILVALGAADRIVGRTDFDTLPPVDTLPSVGEGLRPSVERIVTLEPDLVIRFAAASDRSTPRRLDDLGIPHMAVRPDRIDDVRRIVASLGSVTGRTEVADSLLEAMNGALADVAERVRQLPTRRVAFVVGGSPPWVAGPDTFIDELLEVAGAENVFEDLDDLYGPVSREAFVSRSIDAVLAVEGTDLRLPDPDLPVRRVPADIQTPGLDLGRSAETLARAIHPGAFR